jgi:hypothetical protein
VPVAKILMLDVEYMGSLPRGKQVFQDGQESTGALVPDPPDAIGALGGVRRSVMVFPRVRENREGNELG